VADSKLIRLELEWDDGSVEKLEGEDADKWIKLMQYASFNERLKTSHVGQGLAELKEKWQITQRGQ
jgi:hypothetical protein